MRENIVRITTHDTKQTYEYPRKKGKEDPQLWEVTLQAGFVNNNSGQTQYLSKVKSVFLTQDTLMSHGLVGQVRDKDNNVIVSPKTPEDLILELLEIVGVYPTED